VSPIRSSRIGPKLFSQIYDAIAAGVREAPLEADFVGVPVYGPSHEPGMFEYFLSRTHSVAAGARAARPSGNPLQLLQVIQIVPAHGFDDGLERHLAALRMAHFARERFRR
jgi:hypothetical protein